ncbi:MAG: hypothetical protein Fur0025_25720 [Oscillatoriaceae cyanobacterium]
MTDKPDYITGDYVINISDDTQLILISNQTFLASEFMKATRKQLLANVSQTYVHYKEGWFDDGVECKVLKPGAKWQKGKIRITLEFTPDEDEEVLEETETPAAETNPPVQPATQETTALDEIRRQLTQT